MKPRTEYIINFYIKNTKTLDDYTEHTNKAEAIKAFKQYSKYHSGEYDIKLFKAITTYEEIKIEK